MGGGANRSFHNFQVSQPKSCFVHACAEHHSLLLFIVRAATGAAILRNQEVIIRLSCVEIGVDK